MQSKEMETLGLAVVLGVIASASALLIGGFAAVSIMGLGVGCFYVSRWRKMEPPSTRVPVFWAGISLVVISLFALIAQR